VLLEADEGGSGSLARKATSLSIPIASLKFPPVHSISYSTTRYKDWDDILTSHTAETLVRSWTMLNKRLGKHAFEIADSARSVGKKRSPAGSVKVVLCVI